MAQDPEVTYSVGDFHVEGRQAASARLRVSRAVYDQPSFDSTYGLCDPGPPLNPWENIKKNGGRWWSRKVVNKKCNRQTLYNDLVRWIPFIDWIRKYDVRNSLVTDVVAGITVGILNVPQGMAYAMLANCPPVTGLYTSFFPIIVYFFMATSRQCSMGTFSIVSMMTSKTVRRWGGHFIRNETGHIVHPEYNQSVPGTPYNQEEWGEIQVASAEALLIGVWQLVFGLIGAGGLAVYLSDQLVQGFTCGAAFHVFTSQLKSLFGLKIEEYYGAGKIVKTYIRWFQIVRHTHIPSLVVSVICMVFLIAVKIGINDNRRIMRKIRVPIPAELIVVVFGTLASYLMDLENKYHVEIVKNIPMGLPPPTLPDFSVMGSIIPDSFSNAVVGLAITVTLGMLFATKHGYAIDPNQEFKAQGIGNILGSFFQCFPSGASVARSAVQNDVGGKTQIVSVIQCVIVLIVVLALGKFLEPLPKPCLGAIVMVSVFHLLAQAIQLHKLWKLSLIDWSIFVVVFLGVLFLDVDLGLALGVGWAIMSVMLRLQKPKVGPLGRLPGTDIYRRTDVYKTATEVPGVKIVRVDAPIYFANAAYIKQRLYALADLNNLINKWKAEHPLEQTITPAVDQEENYAYTLALTLDETGDGSSTPDGSTTISMENLTNVSRKFLAQEGILMEEEKDTVVKHLIIDCSEICFVDVTGVGFLKKCQNECESIGVELLLAATNKPVRDLLYVCGAGEYIKEYQLFVTVHDAVLYAVNAQKFRSSVPYAKSAALQPSFSSTPHYGNTPLISHNERLADVTEHPGEDNEALELHEISTRSR